MFIVTQNDKSALNVENITKIFVDDAKSRTGTYILFAYMNTEQYEVLYEDKSEEKVRRMFECIITDINDEKSIIDISYLQKVLT